MSTIIVSTTSGLLGALKHATAGETIELAPGSYSGVTLPNIHPTGMVTITSEYIARPASIDDLYVNQSSNLSFKSLDFNATADRPSTPGGGDWSVAYSVGKSDNIDFIGDNFHGVASSSYMTSVSGISLDRSDNVMIENSSFSYFYNGVSDYASSEFTANNNTFTHIFTDGIHGGGSSNVNITHNSFTDMHEDPADPDHPDAIQFFTEGFTTSASNFYIANNTITRGSGTAVQGIFFRDEMGDIPFQHVTILNNNLTGTWYRGISVVGANNLNLADNVVTSYTDNYSAIEVQSVTNASVHSNKANKYFYTDDVNLNASGNIVTPQVALPGKSGFAHAVLGTEGAAQVQGSLDQDWGVPLGMPSLPNVLAVPEPLAWGMMVVGFAVAGMALRVRRHTQSEARAT